MAETTEARVKYADKLLPNDRRVAVLAHGSKKGLWKYLARVDGFYLIERGGKAKFLTDADVDRLVFDFFMEH